MNVEMPVKKIMTENVIAVYVDDPFDKIQKIFARNTFHHLPVIDREGAVVGIISKENLLRNLRKLSLETSGNSWTQRYYASIKAEDLMTPNPIVLDPDDTVGLAADLFMANLFHALPIVEDGILQGIVTTHDLLKLAFTNITIEEE